VRLDGHSARRGRVPVQGQARVRDNRRPAGAPDGGRAAPLLPTMLALLYRGNAAGRVGRLRLGPETAGGRRGGHGRGPALAGRERTVRQLYPLTGRGAVSDGGTWRWIGRSPNRAAGAPLGKRGLQMGQGHDISRTTCSPGPGTPGPDCQQACFAPTYRLAPAPANGDLPSNDGLLLARPRRQRPSVKS